MKIFGQYEDIEMLRRHIHFMDFPLVRRFLMHALDLEEWPGDGQVLTQLLIDHPIHVTYNDQEKRVDIEIADVIWSHHEGLSGVFKASLFYFWRNARKEIHEKQAVD